jgi:hypothetical protein
MLIRIHNKDLQNKGMGYDTVRTKKTQSTIETKEVQDMQDAPELCAFNHNGIKLEANTLRLCESAFHW